MPQNVLLHFPIVDLVCLQRSVREHTRRVSRFIHEHNNYLSKCKLLNSDKELTPFPLSLTRIPSLACAEDVLLSEDDNCCATSDFIGGKSDSAINRVKLFELNSLYGISDLEWLNSVEDFGNLTTISCPVRFPSEEKPIFLPISGFETFVLPPKVLNHDIENIEKKYSEFVCELGNELRKIDTLTPSVFKKVKEEQHDTKMERNTFSDEMDDEVQIIEMNEKSVEVITISDEDDDVVQENTSNFVETGSRVSILAGPSRENPARPLFSPVPDSPYLSSEVVESLPRNDSSEPPLIFPEIDPPLWTFSGSNSRASSDDIQPPVLIPQQNDSCLTPEKDSTPLLASDDSQTPLMSSEDLTPMLIDTETPEGSPLSSAILMGYDSPANESSLDSVTSRDSNRKSIFPTAASFQHESVIVFPRRLTSNTAQVTNTNNTDSCSPQQSESSSSDAMDTDVVMISPTKTNDITKIKGWKKKQFVMEKPAVNQSCNSNKEEMAGTSGAAQKSQDERQVMLIDDNEDTDSVRETPENAFVCDSLDKFLEREANLNIDYEVPHLYAELGITLTKDDVYSKPNMTEEELKRFEGKYRVPIDLNDHTYKLVKSGNVGKRGVKRKLKQGLHSSKVRKLEVNRSKKSTVNARKKETPRKLGPNPKSNQTKVTSQRSSSSTIESTNLNGRALEGHKSNKVLGLALYPGPNAPLPKVVQRHLDGIRSYRNIIDRNWANFALSALDVPKKNWYERMILPIQLTTENSVPKESTVVPATTATRDSESKVNEAMETCQQSSKQDVLTQNSVVLKKSKKIRKKPQKRTALKKKKQSAKAKDTRALAEEVNDRYRVWCLEHKRFNCQRCIANSGEGGTHNTDLPMIVVSPSLLLSDKNISSLLVQKLPNSHWRDVDISNIDMLRTTVENALELVKFSLLRESFIKNQIFVWYIKPHPDSRNKPRVFLTFSETPPLPSAIRLEPNTKVLEKFLPIFVKKIIKDGAGEDVFAITICNENVWGIYGSLRFLTSIPGNSEGLKREEISIPIYPPELETISRVGRSVIKDKVIKYWVVDLTQKFSSLVSNLESHLNTLSRERICGKPKTFCGILILNVVGSRVLWIHVYSKTYPYALIGPYRISESHGLLLRNQSETIPFLYNPDWSELPRYPLPKIFCSLITKIKQQDRELKALWLYDRSLIAKSSYLEIFTTVKKNNFCMTQYDLDVEHGYSLKSLINTSSQTEVKSHFFQTAPNVTLYVYFEVFELGYFEAELLLDDIVVVTNPINSSKVTTKLLGLETWFTDLIRSKISVLPADTELKCHVSRHQEDLGGRMPFNLEYLNGYYMLYRLNPDCGLEVINLKDNRAFSKKIDGHVNSNVDVSHFRKFEALLASDASEISAEGGVVKATNDIDNSARSCAKGQNEELEIRLNEMSLTNDQKTDNSTTRKRPLKLSKNKSNTKRGRKRSKSEPNSAPQISIVTESGGKSAKRSKATKVTKTETKKARTIPVVTTPASPAGKISVDSPMRTPAATMNGISEKSPVENPGETMKETLVYTPLVNYRPKTVENNITCTKLENNRLKIVRDIQRYTPVQNCQPQTNKNISVNTPLKNYRHDNLKKVSVVTPVKKYVAITVNKDSVDIPVEKDRPKTEEGIPRYTPVENYQSNSQKKVLPVNPIENYRPVSPKKILPAQNYRVDAGQKASVDAPVEDSRADPGRNVFLYTSVETYQPNSVKKVLVDTPVKNHGSITVQKVLVDTPAEDRPIAVESKLVYTLLENYPPDITNKVSVDTPLENYRGEDLKKASKTTPVQNSRADTIQKISVNDYQADPGKKFSLVNPVGKYQPDTLKKVLKTTPVQNYRVDAGQKVSGDAPVEDCRADPGRNVFLYTSVETYQPNSVKKVLVDTPVKNHGNITVQKVLVDTPAEDGPIAVESKLVYTLLENYPPDITNQISVDTPIDNHRPDSVKKVTGPTLIGKDRPKAVQKIAVDTPVKHYQADSVKKVLAHTPVEKDRPDITNKVSTDIPANNYQCEAVQKLSLNTPVENYPAGSVTQVVLITTGENNQAKTIQTVTVITNPPDAVENTSGDTPLENHQGDTKKKVLVVSPVEKHQGNNAKEVSVDTPVKYYTPETMSKYNVVSPAENQRPETIKKDSVGIPFQNCQPEPARKVLLVTRTKNNQTKIVEGVPVYTPLKNYRPETMKHEVLEGAPPRNYPAETVEYVSVHTPAENCGPKIIGQISADSSVNSPALIVEGKTPGRLKFDLGTLNIIAPENPAGIMEDISVGSPSVNLAQNTNEISKDSSVESPAGTSKNTLQENLARSGIRIPVTNQTVIVTLNPCSYCMADVINNSIQNRRIIFDLPQVKFVSSGTGQKQFNSRQQSGKNPTNGTTPTNTNNENSLKIQIETIYNLHSDTASPEFRIILNPDSDSENDGAEQPEPLIVLNLITSDDPTKENMVVLNPQMISNATGPRPRIEAFKIKPGSEKKPVRSDPPRHVILLDEKTTHGLKVQIYSIKFVTTYCQISDESNMEAQLVINTEINTEENGAPIRESVLRGSSPNLTSEPREGPSPVGSRVLPGGSGLENRPLEKISAYTPQLGSFLTYGIYGQFLNNP